MVDTTGLLTLAAVQGLAEFLPVSSSGHLVLAERALGIESPGPALELFLHLGTLFSICAVYRRTLARLLSSALHGGREGLRYAAFVALSMVPTFAGYVVVKKTAGGVFDSPRAVSWLMVANGALLLLSAVTDRVRPGGGGPTAKRALAMGLGQALAVLPGISRSGTSIHAGRLAGMSSAKAAEFSFLMSIPVIAGAVLLECGNGGDGAFAGLSAGQAALATAVSALVGCVALRLVLKVIERGKFWMFGLWCAGLGVASLLFG